MEVEKVDIRKTIFSGCGKKYLCKEWASEWSRNLRLHTDTSRNRQTS